MDTTPAPVVSDLELVARFMTYLTQNDVEGADLLRCLNDPLQRSKVVWALKVGQRFDPDTPIKELGLTPGVFNVLKGDGIYTVGELAAKSFDDLFDIRNMGEISVQEVEVALARHGLNLAVHPDPV